LSAKENSNRLNYIAVTTTTAITITTAAVAYLEKFKRTIKKNTLRIIP
jgi:hypothetical protein